MALLLYGVSIAMVVRAGLGVFPWDVLHQGIARRTPFSLGTVTVAVSLVVLLAWLPLRQRPGVGTVANVLVIGLVVDPAVALIPAPRAAPLRVLLMLAGVLLNAAATAAYLGVQLGPGPRDGLMTGLVRRTGGSVRLVRTGIELGVVTLGWLLGGTLGVGTVLYAVGVGPVVQVLLPRVSFGPVPAVRPAGTGPVPGEPLAD